MKAKLPAPAAGAGASAFFALAIVIVFQQLLNTEHNHFLQYTVI